MRKLLVLVSAAFLVAACAQSVTTGGDDAPINAAQPNDPQQDSGVSTTTSSSQGQKDSGSTAQNDSGSQQPQDSGIPQLDAMPDVGPPPPDAATGGGGICNMNDPLYIGKAVIEINKSSPRQCASGCGSNECCFWVYQVCVDL